MNDKEAAWQRVVDAALGRRPADILLVNGRVADLFRLRVLDGLTVALSGEKIAYVGPFEENLRGPETEVVDLGGAYLLPGFIDAHTHLDSLFQCAAFAERALPFGNTTCVTETSMIAGALGVEGVDLFCQDAAGLVMRLFFLSPSLAPPYPEFETSAGFDDDAFDRFIARPDVLGLGETYWPLALNGDSRPRHRFVRVQEMGKSLEGHAAGARERRLTAFRAAGVQSCHEATTLEEARERISLGIAVMIREGYIRREMEQVLPGLDRDELDSGLVMIVTDGADPKELLSQGGMNLLLKKAVSLGIDPLRAVRMLTLTPARHFNLRTLGAITPGNLADLVVVRDLESFDCLKVWAGGRLAAENGRLVMEQKRGSYPAWTRDSFDIEPVTEEYFRLIASGPRVRARVITIASETITQAEEHEMAVREGQVRPDPDRDILKTAHLDRRGQTGPAVGLIKGLGLKSGALATSLIWDTCNILVIGASEAEMAGAVNRLLELGGGFVVFAGGGVQAELPLPIGGLISPDDLATIASRVAGVEKALSRLGCSVARPFLTCQTLPFTGLPFFRLTDRGLVDIRQNRFVEVILGGEDD